MPFGKPQIKYEPIRDFSTIASEKYGDLVNFHFQKEPDEKGFYPKKIQGFTQQGTNVGVTTSKGLALGSYQPSTGTAGLYAAWGQYVYLTTAGAPTKQTGDVAAQVLTTGKDGEFEQAFDDLYYTNGIDTALVLSSGTWAEAGAAEPYKGGSVVAKYLTWHNAMMFALSTVAAPGKLNISDAGDPTTFSGNTKTFRYKGVGQRSLGDYLVIYTEKDIQVVTGSVPSSLAFRPVPNAHPCVSGRTIATVIGDGTKFSATGVESGRMEHWYLGSDYVWAFNGSIFRILGKDSWESFRDELNTAQLANASAYYDPTYRQYRLSVCTGANTTNNDTWAYDVNGETWVRMPSVTAAAYASHGVPSPVRYWIDDNANGKVFVQNSGNGVASPTNALNGAVTDSDLTVVVNDNSDFPDSGVIMIEDEAIYYASRDAGNTDFESCIRGYSGTTKAAHVDTTDVYPAHQYRYRTKHLDFGNHELVKKFQVIWITPKTSTKAYALDVGSNIDRYGWSKIKSFDLAAGGTTWGAFTWGVATWGASEILYTPDNRGPISGRGKTIAIGFEENASIQQTEVFAMEIKMRPLKIK